jgi:hypothetical protein
MFRIIGQVTNSVLQLGKVTRKLTRSFIYITHYSLFLLCTELLYSDTKVLYSSAVSVSPYGTDCPYRYWFPPLSGYVATDIHGDLDYPAPFCDQGWELDVAALRKLRRACPKLRTLPALKLDSRVASVPKGVVYNIVGFRLFKVSRV